MNEYLTFLTESTASRACSVPAPCRLSDALAEMLNLYQLRQPADALDVNASVHDNLPFNNPVRELLA